MSNALQTSSGQKLTIKQRKWLKEYIKTGNATKAALKAYDTKDENTAAVIGHENIRKLNFDELMEESGLTDHLLNFKLAEGLDATKQLASRVIIKNSNAQANEQTDDFIEVPDYAVRHSYLETALKLKKRLGVKETNIAIQNNGDMTLEFVGVNEGQTT